MKRDLFKYASLCSVNHALSMRPTPANMPLPERMAVLTPITSETCCAHTTPRNHSPPRHHCSATALHCCLIHHVGMKRSGADPLLLVQRPGLMLASVWMTPPAADGSCRPLTWQSFLSPPLIGLPPAPSSLRETFKQKRSRHQAGPAPNPLSCLLR